MTLKYCNQCKLTKPLREFAKDKNRKDGRFSYCKLCNSTRARAWAKAHPERTHARTKTWAAANRERLRALARARYKKGGEKLKKKLRATRKAHPEWSRNVHLKANFGISLKQWNSILEAQDNCCACCRSREPGSKHGWHTDHDHKTGRLRGILCQPCNLMLGSAKDSVENLRAGISYLERQ